MKKSLAELECAKCGCADGYEMNLEYCPSDGDYKYPKQFMTTKCVYGNYSEHFHVECGVCNYKWEVPVPYEEDKEDEDNNDTDIPL